MRFYAFYLVTAVTLLASSVAEAATAGQVRCGEEWWFFSMMGALAGFDF